MTNIPRFYDDELLMGYIYRVYNQSGDLYLGNTIKNLVGDIRINLHPYIPTSLNTLSNTLVVKLGCSVKQIIHRHTLYNYYTSFLSDEEKKIVFAKMIEEKKNAYKCIKYMQIPISKYFRYCPECIKIQIEENGEFFLNRVHQLVPVCTKHHIPIQDSKLELKAGRDKWNEWTLGV